MNRRRSFFLGAMLLVFAAAVDVEAKEGFYIGLGTSYNTIDGDFNGIAGLQGGAQVIILPQIDNAFGLDVSAGYQTRDQWSVELDLMRTVHNGTWAGLQGDVTHAAISLNAKYSFRPQEVVQPFLLFGGSYNQLVIKKGAEDLLTGATGDAKLTGSGLNFGFGIDTYLNPHVSLGLGFTYRYVNYTEASGAGQKGTIDNGLSGNGFGMGVNVAYHF